jgi:hypothetical protein
MTQVARNFSDAAEGFLIGKRYLVHDRDPLFTAEFSKNHQGEWDRIGEIAGVLAESQMRTRSASSEPSRNPAWSG